MTLRLVYVPPGGKFATEIESIRVPMAEAVSESMRQVAEFVKLRARANIAAAGFSTRWQNALRVDVYPKGQTASLRSAVHIYHRIAYAGVFEEGASIGPRGNGLLWVPLSGAKIGSLPGGKRMTVRDYIANVGPLHPINVPGKPPLLAAYFPKGGGVSQSAARAGERMRRAGRDVRSVPMFVGLQGVNVRARFGIMDIVEDAQRSLAQYYIAALK